MNHLDPIFEKKQISEGIHLAPLLNDDWWMKFKLNYNSPKIKVQKNVKIFPNKTDHKSPEDLYSDVTLYLKNPGKKPLL